MKDIPQLVEIRESGGPLLVMGSFQAPQNSFDLSIFKEGDSGRYMIEHSIPSSDHRVMGLLSPNAVQDCLYQEAAKAWLSSEKKFVVADQVQVLKEKVEHLNRQVAHLADLVPLCTANSGLERKKEEVTNLKAALKAAAKLRARCDQLDLKLKRRTKV
ncbi:hypothetical protein U1Q18_029493 [Sarracenia purpurea var. burkii]